MFKATRIAIVAAALALPSLALAKGGTTQNHHCKMPDGTMDTAKTHKECTAAKGTWVKDAATKDAGKSDAAGATKTTPPPASPAPAK